MITLMEVSMKKALVFGGGGSKGSYEAGVCLALNELGYTFDLVTGCSIGALCGAIYVQGDSNKLASWISSFSQAAVSTTLFMFPNQYEHQDLRGQSAQPFYELFCKNGPSIQALIDKYQELFDFDKFMASSIDYACNAYNISQNKGVAFYKKEMEKETVLTQIFSSTAYFPAFNLVEMNGEFYADGGYEAAVPYALAQEMGAEQILAIDISEFEDKDPFEPDPQNQLIRPLLKLHYYLDFSAIDLQPQVQEGYLETLKYLNEAPGYLYTFYKEDFKLLEDIEHFCSILIQDAGETDILDRLHEGLEKIYLFFFGYIPRPLHNIYEKSYEVGRLIEMIGYICGIDMFQQYHFKDFMKQILVRMDYFNSDPNTLPKQDMAQFMELKGCRDMIVFFHSALLSYGLHLPEGFDRMKEKYLLPYYIAIAWIVLEKCRLLLDL